MRAADKVVAAVIVLIVLVVVACYILKPSWVLKPISSKSLGISIKNEGQELSPYLLYRGDKAEPFVVFLQPDEAKKCEKKDKCIYLSGSFEKAIKHFKYALVVDLQEITYKVYEDKVQSI